MLNQIVTPAVRGLLRSVTKVSSVRTAATKVPLRNTMDDLPIPNGSWETQYKANQSKYNMHLAAGVIFTCATLLAAVTSGLFPLEVFYAPPYPPKH